MKRLITLLLLIMICFSAVSCEVTIGNEEKTTSEPTSTTALSKKDPYGGFIVDFGPFIINSYEEYLDYVELVDQYLPDDFIYYDQISFLGEFYNFQNLCATSNPRFPPETHDREITYYEYTVKIPQTNQLMTIYIEINETTDWVKGNEIPDSLIDPHNLRVLLKDSKASGIYRIKDYIYKYSEGRLTYIYAQIGTTMVELCTDFDEIPLDIANYIVYTLDESTVNLFFRSIFEN